MKNRFELVSFGEGCFLNDPSVLKLYDHFVRSLGFHPKGNVWIDKVDNKLFSLDLNYNNAQDHREALFLTDETSFLTDGRHGLPFFKNSVLPTYPLGDLISKKDIILEKTSFNQQAKGKTIFLIGAGPSSNLIDLKDVEADQLWICNDFLNNEKTKNLDISLFYMSNLSYARQREFNYFKENKVTTCFDTNVFRDYTIVAKYKKIKKEKCFIFSTRMFTTIGTVPRLMFLAASMGVKKIKVVGLDGHTERSFDLGTSLSSFEKGRKKIPNGQTFGAQCREYLLFWEFMKLKFPKLKIENLSIVNEDNISGNIQEFVESRI